MKEAIRESFPEITALCLGLWEESKRGNRVPGRGKARTNPEVRVGLNVETGTLGRLVWAS